MSSPGSAPRFGAPLTSSDPPHGDDGARGRDVPRNGDELTARQAWATEVAARMTELPDRQAAALRLVYSHELPYSEVAAWLGTTAAEVHSLLADGLRRLGQLMQTGS